MANLTQEQLQARISGIAEVAPDDIDLQMINEFEDEPMEDATDWEEYKIKREERAFNGNISLRIPRELHQKLVETAKEQGVSLNQYCLYKLSSF